MMPTDNIILERHLRKTTIVSNLIGLFVATITAMSIGYGFYYKTSYTQTKNSEEITILKTDVKDIKKDIQSSLSNGSVSSTEIENLKQRMLGIENGQMRIEDKIDKLIFMVHK